MLMRSDAQAEYYHHLRWNVRMTVLDEAAFRLVGILFNTNVSIGALTMNLAPPEVRPLDVVPGGAAELAYVATAGQGVVVALPGYPGFFLLLMLSPEPILPLHDPAMVKEAHAGARL